MLSLIISLSLLLIGFTTGSYLEKRHYASIIEREKEYCDVIVICSRKVPQEVTTSGGLVLGSVVIASDHFKRFVAGLISIFGGRMSTYESLLDRGRREAVLRMKEEARDCGANMIVNVKFETVTLNNIQTKQSAMIEVLAYGTAVKYPND